jgi:hypothetical protein
MRWHQPSRWIAWTRFVLALGLGLSLLSGCNRESDDAGGAADEAAVSDALPGDGSDLSATKSEDASPAAEGAADAVGDEAEADPAGAEDAVDPQAEASEASGAVRVEFEPGSEGGMISGDLEGGGDVDRYVLRAMAGQTLQLRVRGVSNGSVEIGLAGSEGAAMGSSGAQAPDERNRFEMQLPTTDDYTVSVTASDAAPPLSYDLEIRISGEPSDDAAGADGADRSGGGADNGASGAAPEIVVFAPYEDSARIEGDLKGGELDRYRLRASAGQELILSVQSDAAPTLTVTDPAGEAVEPIRVGRVGPVFALSQAGLYVVGIQHASGGDPIDYSLQITIVEGQAGDAADATGGAGSGASGAADATGDWKAADARAATQLFFRSGADSTTVQGLLGGGGRDDYRLTAAGGQRMQVSLTAPGSSDYFQVFVSDAAGKLLASGLDDAGTVEIALPKQQDYLVSVIAQSQGAEEAYSLTIAIR